jgi:hypothetical protein
MELIWQPTIMMCYAAHPDTANRNVANRIMLNVLDSVSDPTARE